MKCRNCGVELVPGAIFCPNCGKPVGSSEFSSYEYTTDDQPAASPTPAAPITPVDQQVVSAQQRPSQPLPPTQLAQQPPFQHLPPAQPGQSPLAGQQSGPNPQQPAWQELQPGRQPGSQAGAQEGNQAEAHTQWPSFQAPQTSAPQHWPPFPVQQPVQNQPNQPLYQPQQPYVSPQYYQGTAPFNQGFAQPTPGILPQAPQAPQAPQPAAPPRRSGLSPAMVVLLVVLALLVGGGGVFAYYTISHRNQALTPASSPTRAATTPSPSIPTITATDPQQLYTQATAGTPVLNDPLNASNPNGWEAADSGNTCQFASNALEVNAPAAKSGKTAIGVCLAMARSFSNFAYEVNSTIVQGNASGLVFRTDQFARSIYFFGVISDGEYILFTTTTSTSGQTSEKILAAGTSQAIHTGTNQSNLLTVIARGNMIDLYANKQYLNSATDNTATSGLIGVWGENVEGGAVTVSFSSIKVWQL